MASQKPHSTISYNTELFLKEKLDLWVEQHIIQAYQYICHKGEDGDKDHIHVRIEPNKKLDLMDLSTALNEFEPGKKKPRGVRPWRPSKEEDWILYGVHDPEYLALKYGGGDKGEKIPYEWTEIKTSEFYDLETMWIRAKASLKHSSVSMAKRLKNGEKPVNLVLQGENPFLISSLSRMLATTDYEDTAVKVGEYADQINRLMAAISNYGLKIRENKDGDLELYPEEEDQAPAILMPEAGSDTEDKDDYIDLLKDFGLELEELNDN